MQNRQPRKLTSINNDNMKTINFQNLIQSITGRDLVIKTDSTEIVNGAEYYVYRILPITGAYIGFYWKAASTDEKLLRSFITAFCTKYREPSPAKYNEWFGDKEYRWEWKTEEQKENAYFHHRLNMFSKNSLMSQVEANFSKPEMQTALIRYGFYPTEYGVGIFCFWETEAVRNAVAQMAAYLRGLAIPYANEYSDAKWVFRFKLGLTKDSHATLLNNFSR